MINITTSDLMMVAGSFGLKMDYSVRFSLKLKDEINSEMLHHAVEKTQKRYPYLSLPMVCVLFARAIDTLYPKKARDIRNSYIVNARPMFGSKTHHNCVQTIINC